MKTIVIGASTGGPNALERLISHLPAGFSAAVIVIQHLPGSMTASLAERLGRHSALPVSEVRHEELLEPGHVYVVPGDRHFFVKSTGGAAHSHLLVATTHPHPSIDMGFTSVAEHFGPDMLGVILTGMGHDGTLGTKAIKQFGGMVIAQDESTSAVYGMPKSVQQSGRFDQSLPLEQIAPVMIQFARDYV